jgi:hypothetical protein
MALLAKNSTCVICQKPMDLTSHIVGFPAFVANPRDRIAFFSDGAFHEACFNRHPLAREAQSRYQEFRDRTPPRNRSCSICGLAITNPNEYVGLGHLTADETSPAFRFNYFQFHKTCAVSWPEVANLRAAIEALGSSGEWDDFAFEALVKELDRLQPAGTVNRGS